MNNSILVDSLPWQQTLPRTFMMERNRPQKLLLVCSSGGHFYQLFSLQDFWKNYSRVWVTFNQEDTFFRLGEEKLYWAYAPTNRNLKNFFLNLILAWNIISQEKPDMIISTGAGVAVPFIFIGRLLQCKTIYIESLTRVKEISLTGKIIYPFVDHFLVQWEELSKRYQRAEFVGRVL
jgi:UDP-N-acetylglucosamine:LPS N-acetylglucosamine transferase